MSDETQPGEADESNARTPSTSDSDSEAASTTTPSAQIEAAKSGRAKCRHCRETIAKGELRLGESVDSPYGEGQTTLWYHLRCGALKRPEAALVGLSSYAGEVEHKAQLVELAESGARFPMLTYLASIEASPSGRARCQHCRELIEKGALRLCRHNEADVMGIPTQSYIHLSCAEAYLAQTSEVDAEADPASSEELKKALRSRLTYHAETLPAPLRESAIAAIG